MEEKRGTEPIENKKKALCWLRTTQRNSVKGKNQKKGIRGQMGRERDTAGGIRDGSQGREKVA